MKWFWSLLGIIPAVLAILRTKKRKHQRMQLQLWTRITGYDDAEFGYSLHFPSMILRFCEDSHRLYLFEVKRQVNGDWKARYTDSSWEIHQIHSIVFGEGALPSSEPELDEMLRRTNQSCNVWFDMKDSIFDSSLETAYQKYIHSPDVPIVAMTSWQKEESLELKKLRELALSPEKAMYWRTNKANLPVHSDAPQGGA